MANVKINDLVNAAVSASMQFETDIGGVTPNNVTATQIKTFTDVGLIKADGTIPLTADWDAGAFKITAEQFESDIATGTAPLIVASTTKVASLNVDQVDGYDLDQAILIASSPTHVGLTLSGLPVVGGIVQTDAAGVLSSSVTLPDGTLATTQSPGDNTTKPATTAFVTAAVGTVDTWNEVMHLGNTFTILDTENLSATINQNDTTNNPAALIINNTGSGNDITLPNSSSIKNGVATLAGLTISSLANANEIVHTDATGALITNGHILTATDWFIPTATLLLMTALTDTDTSFYIQGNGATSAADMTLLYGTSGSTFTRYKQDSTVSKVSFGANVTEYLINDFKEDVDTIIRSKDFDYMFHIDALLNRLGLNTASPQALLHVNGDALIEGSLGVTGTRLIKGWFTDLEITNYPSVNGTALSNQYLATIDTVSFADLTVDNINLNGNAITTSSGDLDLVSATGIVTINSADEPTLRIESSGSGANAPTLSLIRPGSATDWRLQNIFGILKIERSVDNESTWDEQVQFQGNTGEAAMYTSNTSDNLLIGGGSNLYLQTYSGSWNNRMQITSSGAISCLSGTTFALATGTTVNEITTIVSGASTDDQLPTAKAVNNLVGAGMKVAAPATKTSTGSIGNWAFDETTGYHYVCYDTDKWSRSIYTINW